MTTETARETPDELINRFFGNKDEDCRAFQEGLLFDNTMSKGKLMTFLSEFAEAVVREAVDGAKYG